VVRPLFATFFDQKRVNRIHCGSSSHAIFKHSLRCRWSNQGREIEGLHTIIQGRLPAQRTVGRHLPSSFHRSGHCKCVCSDARRCLLLFHLQKQHIRSRSTLRGTIKLSLIMGRRGYWPFDAGRESSCKDHVNVLCLPTWKPDWSD
jgi:hypothetical protein